MGDATGEADGTGLRVAFDRRLKLEFHGATVTSDAGLLAFRELDDALGLTAMAAEVLADPRTGRNGRHSLIAQLRQSVFGRLAGYEDVNDADRLGRDPAMQPRQLPAHPGATGRDRGVVADQPAGEGRQDRGEGDLAWPLPRLPDGRGGGAARAVRPPPRPDRQVTSAGPGPMLTREGATEGSRGSSCARRASSG